MNILINTQGFGTNNFSEELSKLAENKNINKIYLTSSLMHTLDIEILDKYQKIRKVIIIDTITLFNHKSFIKSNFTLNGNFIEDEIYMFSDYISAYRWLPITKRKDNDMISFSMRFYYDVYNFWNTFFLDHQINTVIQLNDEHSSLDSILIRVAKEHGIKRILTTLVVGLYAQNKEFYFGFFDNNKEEYIILDNLKDNSNEITKIDVTKSLLATDDVFKVGVKEKIKFIFFKLKQLNSENSSFISKILKLNCIIYNKINTRILLQKQYYYIKRLYFYYEKIAISNLNISQKYIYYCLHFDPEAATLPKDRAYFNQLLNLRILASSIPKSWKIYVKEHPHQLEYKSYKKDILANHIHSVDNFRSKAFYDYINSFDNVVLVSFTNEHHEMIKHAKFIASNTGTVYREASYYKKQCISFSKSSFYGLLPNIHSISDVKSCKEIIKKYNNIEVEKDLVNSIFTKYSIMLKYNKNMGSHLISFINRNNLVHND